VTEKDIFVTITDYYGFNIVFCRFNRLAYRNVWDVSKGWNYALESIHPLLHTWLIVEKTELKKYWFWLQLIPVAGQFITIWITIIFVMQFKRVNMLHHTATVLVPFIYFPYLGFSKEEKFYGPSVMKLYHKPASVNG
jgi:hypothetical protein